MPELEKEEPVEQKGVGQKILTLYQMLNRLPICLAQLKAGNNFKKMKNWNQTTIVFFVLFKLAN